MDRIMHFRQAIIDVINDYVEVHSSSVEKEGLVYEKLIDISNQRFQLVLVGWQDEERYYARIFHVDIINNKIWIQDDNLEYSVAERLGDKGISKKDIVLAYFSPSHRAYTAYAVS
jgi:phage terminase large subunit GpA-like protein